MTPSEWVLELFRPPIEGEIVGLADRLIAWTAASENSRLEIQFAPSADPSATVTGLEITVDGAPAGETDLTAARLFRTLLARLAMVGHEETGIIFQPYSGRFTLTRTPVIGRVCLDIEFGNSQTTGFYLRVLRTPFHGTDSVDENDNAARLTPVESSDCPSPSHS